MIQRGTIVAMLLYLLGVMDYQEIFSAKHAALRGRLVTAICACKVPTHIILTTLRFREELSFCRRALLPNFESDSETSDDDEVRSGADDDVDDDEGDEDDETEREDALWVAQRIGHSWGLSDYLYFLSDSGQEFSFASWATRGVAVLTYSLFANESLNLSFREPLLAPVLAPQSALFFVSAYAHTMIVDEHLETRVKGFKLLQSFLTRCPPQTVRCKVDSNDAHADSFHLFASRFQERNWIDPIVQGMTSVMVSFPNATERTASLAVFRLLIASINANDRFWFLTKLALKCPYANVSAVLIDSVRSDAVLSWQQEILTTTPYTSSAIVDLVNDVLTLAAERDLVLHADLIASCLSLLRFLLIRDKGNMTGVHHQGGSLSTLCHRIQRRLEQKLAEDTSSTTNLFLLEATLSSTTTLLDQVNA